MISLPSDPDSHTSLKDLNEPHSSHILCNMSVSSTSPLMSFRYFSASSLPSKCLQLTTTGSGSDGYCSYWTTVHFHHDGLQKSPVLTSCISHQLLYLAMSLTSLSALRAKGHLISEFLLFFLISSFLTFYLLSIALNALNALKPINKGFSQGTSYILACPKLAPDSPQITYL